MITCNLMGGLGNQLFQIFTTISYAIHNQQAFVFLHTDTLGTGSTTVRPTYWHNFLSTLQLFVKKELPVIECMLKESGFDYDELPPISEIFPSNIYANGNNSVVLFGFFQSYKYFEKYKNNICRLIRLETQKDTVKPYMPKNTLNLTSIHFRFGDYKQNTHMYVLLTHAYYKNCIAFIQDKLKIRELNILYFCEDHDLEDVLPIINQLTWDFPTVHFEQVLSGIPDYMQMLMMSVCNHNIIANSTFSWWGAYFNANEDKIVCYPDSWFKAKRPLDQENSVNTDNIKDLCLPYWNKIAVI